MILIGLYNYWNIYFDYQDNTQHKMNKIPILKKIGQNQEVVYDENDVLGQGAFGTVYGGIMNKDANQRVAVKQLKYAGKMLKRRNPNFDREIQILSKLDNPYIIKFYFCYIDPKTDQVFIVTERCQSKDLSKQILENKNFSSQRIFRYAYQLIYAMKYMHQKKCMHRDIKPQNILLTLQDNIKIADLGLAKSILNNNIQSIQAHTLSGTPIYAAPQIIFQQEYSAKCDVWSAGCLIYQLLTKKKLMEIGKTMISLKKYLKQFKQPVNKAKYIGQFKGTFWYKILDQMLTFQDQQRSSFKDILAYFEQENKKNYHINIEGQRQIKGYIEQKQTLKYRANQPEKNDSQVQKQINQQVPKKPIIKILSKKTQQKQLKNSPQIEAKKPVVGQGHSRIKFGPIRKLDTHVDNKSLQTEAQVMKAQQIEQAKQIFSRAYLLIDFKYEKIKLIYQYLYQFQIVKNYPVSSCFVSILAFLLVFWYKMEILQFMKQFSGDKYMEFQGQMLTLQRIDANNQFLNRRNKILNQFSQRLPKSDNYMKRYIDHIFQDKYKAQLTQASNKNPQLIKILRSYQETQVSAEMASKMFENILKDFGMPIQKIEQLAFEEKLKIYRLLAALFLLIQKQSKFPDSLLKKNKSDAGQKDKMIKKFQELKQMAKSELMLIIK